MRLTKITGKSALPSGVRPPAQCKGAEWPVPSMNALYSAFVTG